MATASNIKLLRVITKASSRGATDFADAITAALAQQTVVVAGTAAAEQVLPGLAASLRQDPNSTRLNTSHGTLSSKPACG